MQAPERVVGSMAVDHPDGDACLGLELLDVEPGADGSAQGVWLRNRQAGPSLVRPGRQFSSFTLTRIATAGPGHQSAKLWFANNPRPCELEIVRGIDLARALATLPAPAKAMADALPPPALTVRGQETRERVPLHRIPIVAAAAKGYGLRSAGTGQPSSASVDAGLR
jgi:hypothetical protein